MSKFLNTAFLVCGILLFYQCSEETEEIPNVDIPEAPLNEELKTEGIKLVVLGTVQDAGSPQIGCQKKCCAHLFEEPDHDRMVVSLGVIDEMSKQTYLFDATPDLPAQMELLNKKSGLDLSKTPDGIFLTHAHIGHYTGLMYLGKEAMNADQVPVYAMPKMFSFLETNGPWSQLVLNENIALKELRASDSFGLGQDISVTPILVPHRDEFSETVGFVIAGPNKTVLFIPDIDKWDKWDQNIVDWVEKVDYAFLDATFYDAEEINNRDISEIPHPFVVESMETFKELDQKNRNKIHLIHFNHTNPLLDGGKEQVEKVLDFGFKIAETGMILDL